MWVMHMSYYWQDNTFFRRLFVNDIFDIFSQTETFFYYSFIHIYEYM